MNRCDEQLLSAYADGELSPEHAAKVEDHLRQCASCAAALRQIREASRLLREYPFEDIRPDELRDAHAAIDSASDRPILRLGFTLGVLAASLLIVSCAWLMELPAATRSDQSTNPSTMARSAPPPQWERMAMTLRADPLPHPGDDTSQFADAQLADWMLKGLSPREN
jgi:anti-sigma factor RsiW